MAEIKTGGGSGRPHNPGLLKLIEAKRRWQHRPDPVAAQKGFLGWHERGYLPHFDAPYVTQFVTFMLEDAFPITRHQEWQPILLESDASLRRRKLEAWLDRGHGLCLLRRAEVASRLESILRQDDGQAYQLTAWVIMPNHVHLVVNVWETPLSRLLNLWKGRSAREANELVRRSGRLWQREFFDTLVRDADHLGRLVRYTENNPVKAGLVHARKLWPWSSARYRDEFERLPWQRTQSERTAAGPASWFGPGRD